MVGFLDDTTTTDDHLFVLRSDGSRPTTPGVTVRAFVAGRDARFDYTTAFTITEFGAQATTIDDRDGDGARELVISAHAFNGARGQVLVLSGVTTGIAATSAPGVTLTTINGGSGARLGAILLARSDLDSDFDGAATDDLLVVGRLGTSDRGFLWYGGALPVGTTTTASASFSFATPTEFRIGFINRTGSQGVARWVGDLDDDGLEDVCWATPITTGDDGAFEVFD